MSSADKICVSIANCSLEDCLDLLKNLQLAEIRLDKMQLSNEGIRRIFSQPLKLIATCRTGANNEEEQKQLLISAINAGAAFIDIEVDSNEEYKKELIEHAKMHGCQVILSYHNYKKTPNAGELDQIVRWCFVSGADIAKIACRSITEQDNARLLALLDSDKKTIVVGMGEKGRITRIVAPLLGSLFTFASISEGKETAEGQMEKKKLEQLMGELENV